MKHLTPGKVWPALSLVGYPDEVAKAIKFIFNDMLLCDDAASAQAVTFTRNIGVWCVTLNGDIHKPSVMTSGGAVLSRTGVLVRAQEPRVVEEWVKDTRRTLQVLEHEEAKGCAARQAWRACTRELEIRVHKLRLLQEHVGGSNAAWVCHSSPHLPLDLPLTKGQPPCFRSTLIIPVPSRLWPYTPSLQVTTCLRPQCPRSCSDDS